MEDTYNKLREMGYVEGAKIVPAHMHYEIVTLPTYLKYLIEEDGVYAFNRLTNSKDSVEGWTMKLYDRKDGWAEVVSKENEYTIEELEKLTGIPNLKIKK